MNERIVFMQRPWGLWMSEGDDMAKHLNQFRELEISFKAYLMREKKWRTANLKQF